MTTPNTAGIKGYIRADSRSFRNGKFDPINMYYSTFYPSDVIPEGAKEATLTPLNDGEFYQAVGDRDRSEGRGGTVAVGNFLVYEDAYKATFGIGAQGGIGQVVIMTPTEPQEISAIDENGEKVVMAIIPRFRSVDLASRLVFSEPIA